MTETLAPLEIKFVDSEAGTISGYASLFGPPPDRTGDIVAPGAFTASLAEATPLMLWSHKADSPVGTWTSVAEDERGLAVEGRLTLDSTAGRDAHALLKSGAVGGLSIGYRTRQSERIPGGGRLLKDVELIEISIVAIPAEPRARVLSVKSSPAEEKIMETEIEVKDAPDTSRLDKMEETFAAFAARMDELEKKANRPGGQAAPEAAAALESKTFEKFLRKGREYLTPLEVKDMTVADDTAGGYLAPEPFLAELLKDITLYSPIRALARVTNISSAAVIMPKRTANLTGAWVGEVAARTESQPDYGQNRYEARELAVYTDVSNQLLEDSAINIADELAQDFAESFGALEGKAFIDGSGAVQPEGILTNVDIDETNSGGAATVTVNGLIAIYHALKPQYRANATWVMNSATLAAVRQLKTADASLQLIMWPGQQIGGAPGGSLLGRPIVEATDMPDIAGGAYPILFGDFNQGYRIFDRVQLSVLRDPYTIAVNGLTRFHARRRLAAGVTKPEAIRKMKIAA